MNITAKRKSNIELLRILCMMCLVAHHFTIHGNLYLNENIFVQRFSLIFAPLGKMFYVVFMVISSYFLSNANVKSKRFWKPIGFYLQFFIIFYKTFFIFHSRLLFLILPKIYRAILYNIDCNYKRTCVKRRFWQSTHIFDKIFKIIDENRMTYDL